VKNEKELLSEYTKLAILFRKASEKMDKHFGPLIDSAIEQKDFIQAKEIWNRIPESTCRFNQWRKIKDYI